jgi:hypothetical protein
LAAEFSKIRFYWYSSFTAISGLETGKVQEDEQNKMQVTGIGSDGIPIFPTSLARSSGAGGELDPFSS